MAGMTVGLLGVVGSLAGSAVSFMGQQKQAEAMQKQERLRKKQLRIDERRKRRQAVREAQRARAEVQATATSQGAQFSSVLPAAQGQIRNQEAQNLGMIQSDARMGLKMFDLNKRVAEGRGLEGLGQGIGSLFSSIG